MAEEKTTSIPKERWGVHETHCCKRHGCKYGDEDCPVELGLIKQRYKCEDGSVMDEDCFEDPEQTFHITIVVGKDRHDNPLFSKEQVQNLIDKADLVFRKDGVYVDSSGEFVGNIKIDKE